MIGSLAGQISLIKVDRLLLNVGGVGYVVFVPPRFLSQLHIGDKSNLYIHTHVREDTLSLFGFTTLAELDLFELLLSVSGIGPKTALMIVNHGVDHIKQAVVKADVEFFRTIPRLGTKNSQKIIIELKSKIGSEKDLDLRNEVSGQTQEMIEILTGMGFSKTEVLPAVKQISSSTDKIENKMRQVLKILGKKKV